MPSFLSGPVQTVLSNLCVFHVSSIKSSLFLKSCRTEDVSVQETGEKNCIFHILAADKAHDLTYNLLDLKKAYLSTCTLFS